MKTAIVTGAAGDLGAAIARRAAEAGYAVALFDRDQARAAAVAETIAGATAYGVDVTDEASVRAAFDQVGVPDLLVNNAGIVRFGPLLEQSIADFRAVLEVDLMGTYLPSWLAGHGMVARGSGVIINITSINSVTPGPNAGAYPAAKAAVAKLTEHMALEWGPAGVRVNCVAPGFIDGGMSAAVFADPGVRALRSGGVPLRRLGTPDDIAAAVMFLASDDANYISGHELVVDGGVVHSLLAQLRREAKP